MFLNIDRGNKIDFFSQNGGRKSNKLKFNRVKKEHKHWEEHLTTLVNLKRFVIIDVISAEKFFLFENQQN